MAHLQGKKIAIIATDHFEESELVEPLTQLRDMGATVDVAAPHDGSIQAVKHDIEPTIEVPVDKAIDELDPQEYDAVIVPGGVVNADHLRLDRKAQEFVRDMAESGKPVASICHGPWLLVSAGLVQGRTLTSYPTLQDDIQNAGGVWVNAEVQIDENLITSRRPDDIPAFISAIEDALVA